MNKNFEFLQQLRQELLTQPTDGNRDPRFWGIRETKRIYGVISESSDGWVVYDSENACNVGDANNIQSVVKDLLDNYNVSSIVFYSRNMEDIESVIDIVNLSFGYEKFTVEYYEEYHCIATDAVFLTKKAAQEHIKRYGHRYTDPHTYVMTASDCSEYEKLLAAIKETDWSVLTPYEMIVQAITDETKGVKTNGESILCNSEEKANAIADLLDAMGYTATTGYYDPKEDVTAGQVDDCTGWWYVEI